MSYRIALKAANQCSGGLRPSYYLPVSSDGLGSAATEQAPCKRPFLRFIPAFAASFKSRRWSLGFRRWTRSRTRQGKPGQEKEFRFKNFDFRLMQFSCPIANWESTIEN